LILDGKCVTNESLLTGNLLIINILGEATPQIKENILELENEMNFNIKQNKRNVIFGGTRVLLHEPSINFKPPGKFNIYSR
jgi:hypothetical protein